MTSSAKPSSPAVPLRAPYNYNTDQASLAAGTDAGGPSPTVQSQKDEADINVIVARFGLTGELPLNQRVPLPEDLDFDSLPQDYREALDLVNAARNSFDSLPSSVRKLHDNDPGKFLAWLETSTPEDRAKLLPTADAGASSVVPREGTGTIPGGGGGAPAA